MQKFRNIGQILLGESKLGEEEEEKNMLTL
jgi:hypothetical protein